MRVLIVGGTKFIGPHVVRRLVTLGHDVIVFHRGQTEAELPSEVAHLHGERARLRDHRAEFERLAPEVVVDMVLFTEQDAHEVVDTFRGLAGRLVVLSSGDVYRAYGRIRRSEDAPLDPVPLSEDAPLRQRLFFARGESARSPDDPMRWLDDYEKILVESVVMSEPSLPGTVLRLPCVYGPLDAHHRLYSYLKRMDDKRPAILVEEAHAAWRWTRGYVEDVAHAIALAVAHNRAAGHVYNVGEAEALSEADWVRSIGSAAGWSGQVLSVPRERLPAAMREELDFSQHLVTDTTRIRAELGFAELVPRDEAMRRTIAWERAHPPDKIDPQQFDYAAEDAAVAQVSRPGE
jgi:nucleoside-diphosphate-sugar epimerase